MRRLVLGLYAYAALFFSALFVFLPKMAAARRRLGRLASQREGGHAGRAEHAAAPARIDRGEILRGALLDEALDWW